jgi:hypothetical protein
MMRNKLSTKFKAQPDKGKWNMICPMNEYRVIPIQDALNYGIIPTGMSDVNSVITGASGNFEGTCIYFAVCCRVDHSILDQDPYFELYEDGNNLPSLYGILHHADFVGRSEPLDCYQLSRIEASGCSVNIQFTAKPDKIKGTLEELRNQGKIQGFDYAWRQIISRKPNII